jgi:hypothetical protein
MKENWRDQAMENNLDGLMTSTKLAGVRLGVVANRALCDDEGSRAIHDRLIAGLDEKIAISRKIAALERAPVDPSQPDDREFYIASLAKDLSIPIYLVDSLYIDCATHEYTVNGGSWQFGLDVETGSTDYPVEVHLEDDELAGLSPVLEELYSLGVDARAYRVKERWQLESAPAATASGPAM